MEQTNESLTIDKERQSTAQSEDKDTPIQTQTIPEDDITHHDDDDDDDGDDDDDDAEVSPSPNKSEAFPEESIHGNPSGKLTNDDAEISGISPSNKSVTFTEEFMPRDSSGKINDDLEVMTSSSPAEAHNTSPGETIQEETSTYRNSDDSKVTDVPANVHTIPGTDGKTSADSDTQDPQKPSYPNETPAIPQMDGKTSADSDTEDPQKPPSPNETPAISQMDGETPADSEREDSQKSNTETPTIPQMDGETSPDSEREDPQKPSSATSTISQIDREASSAASERDYPQKPSSDTETPAVPQMDGETPADSERQDPQKPPSATESPTTDGTEASGKTASEDPENHSVSPSKTHPRVSIQDTKASAVAGAPPKRVTSSRLRMERELSRLKQLEERDKLLQKERRRKEVRKAVGEVRKERERKGVTLTPDVEASRAAIRDIMKEEERMALATDQKKLRDESKALQQQIDDKYGLKDNHHGPKGKKKPGSQNMVVLAQSFYHGKAKDKDGIPLHVRRELTSQEIEDLRMVFDMFDVKGKGYIVPNDVKRAAGMLGFKAKKEVFSGMIEEVTGNKYGRVTFAHFLQFVVKGQRDGDDPYEDILQCFRMLDRDQKGYITASDLRHAADSQKVPLSNRAIREMIQEADVSGDAKVTSDEFILIMLQSSTFRVAH
ncbi:hypothetical protein ACOMHN_045952 [Nucella lapillus]